MDWLTERKNAIKTRRDKRKRSPLPITDEYLQGWWAAREGTPAMREAAGLKRLWDRMPLSLESDELLAGNLFVREVAGFHYGGATWVDYKALDEFFLQEEIPFTKQVDFTARLDAMEAARYHPANPALFTPEENASIAAHAATSTWFGGHMIPDYATVLCEGLSAYNHRITAGRAAHPEASDFYAAMQTMLEAIQIFIRRYGTLAERCAGKPGYDPQRMKTMASDLAHIAALPPASFRQGLQLVWILHLLYGCDSFGRLDDYLLALFSQDLRSGALTEGEALRLLEDFWVHIEEVNYIQNMTIGGVDAEGNPQYSLLTRLCLTATREVACKGPNLCLRVVPEMPEEIWEEALSCLGKGLGLPALYNDAAYLGMLTRAGYPLPVARGYCLAGCSQVMLPGECNFINDIGMYNIAKVMELTLRDGFDPRTGKQVGLHTGKLEEMPCFDALLSAFDAQNAYFIALETSINDKDTLYRRETEGYAMRSLLMRDCLETGKAIYHGGARYNNIELEVIGITNAADSLMGVKTAVFTEKYLTPQALLHALDTDFEGQEALRLRLRAAPKFGNNHPEADALRAHIARTTFAAFNASPSIIGGVYVPGEVIFIVHEPAGKVVGATPEGRRAGTVLADSMGASQGCDLHGPTALLNSVLEVGAKDFFLTTPALNLRFMASLWQQEEARRKIRTLLTSFFDRGGMQVQINVCDTATLRAAQEEPEKYRSLVVRVGGYSDYFVRLSPALREEIISRTEQGL